MENHCDDEIIVRNEINRKDRRDQIATIIAHWCRYKSTSGGYNAPNVGVDMAASKIVELFQQWESLNEPLHPHRP